MSLYSSFPARFPTYSLLYYFVIMKNNSATNASLAPYSAAVLRSVYHPAGAVAADFNDAAEKHKAGRCKLNAVDP
jgi:hypothetical protein